MDVQWVKIRSFHAVGSSFTSRGGIPMARTLCGRYASGEIVTDLPAERSCESCLRIVARMQDAAR